MRQFGIFILIILFSMTANAEIRTLRTRYVSAETLQPYAAVERPYLVLSNEPGAVIDELGDINGRVLEISFDDMNRDSKQYSYSIQHLNADGCLSALSPSEYMRGSSWLDITDYSYSLNTRRLYTHYRFTFPNSDMVLRASGRYAISIYEDGNPDAVVATVQFCVVEPQVGINAEIRSNTDIEFNGRYQQLDINVTRESDSHLGGAPMVNEYFIRVIQNGRTDNAVTVRKPMYVEPNRLRYMNIRELIFEGGNEFRHLDIYSTFSAGTGVDRIRFDHNDYHAFLEPNNILRTAQYSFNYDANGQYLINAEKTVEDDTEAEYMWVHWFLSCNEPIPDAVIYIAGDLFGNDFTPENRMTYDYELNGYYLNALLKQGGYDYEYLTMPVSLETKRATTFLTEGSHWQTKNEYAIEVYYRPFGSRADRLVGRMVLQ